MSPFRILFVSDLHGSESGFRKFINSVPTYRPDLLIYGGDLLGKTLVPVFPAGPDQYRWYPNGKTAVTFSDKERAGVERQIADQGRYSYVVDPPRWAELQREPAALESICIGLARERLRRWLGLVRERLEPSGLPVIMNVGNDDPDEILDLLRAEAPRNVLIPEAKVVTVANYEIFGCGYANMTPWHCPRDLPEAELQRVLEKTSSTLGDPRKTIFDIHAPPADTALDLAPQLDADLRPRTASGEMLLTHVGSPSVRALIERVQPMLSLHGHIHESRAVDRL
ncbi:MAG TPA: metallophosphoesterase, partial [Thermoplasmata archaeon]|nr:metallophosphoesterase [Thermoplasmata archaeon]